MDCKVSKGTIHYDICGEGFPLVILHAMGTDHRSMKGWIEPVFNQVEGFQRVYVDLPAHGWSDIDESLNSTDDMLENLLYFIDNALGEREFSLIGASFGGYLAQGILHKRRTRVKGICLLAPAMHIRERNLPERKVLVKDEFLFESLEPDIRAAFETLFIHQTKESLKAFMEEVQPGRILADREFLTSDWRSKGYYLAEPPFHDVKTLPQQALILLGKQDYICGYKDHLILMEQFPNSTFVVLNHAGHMLQIEKREVVQGLLKEWITGSHEKRAH